jgi:DNA-binding response OmpR family regulator
VDGDRYSLFACHRDKANKQHKAVALAVISPSNAVDAYEYGADIVLTPPLKLTILAAQVRAVMRRYGGMKH